MGASPRGCKVTAMDSRILRGEHWAHTLLETLSGDCADPLSWMQREARILKSDRHSLVGLVELGGALCHLKAYRPKGPLQSLQFKAGRGRGVSAFDHALALRAGGLSVPEPRACLCSGGVMLLLTEGIIDGTDLKSLWLSEPGEEFLAEVLERAGVMLAAWHRAGFSHGDSKWSNVLVAPDAMYLVDLEAVQQTTADGAGATRDLARFVVNAEDMGLAQAQFRRFLNSYCAAAALEEPALVRRVLPRVQSLRRRHLKQYGQRGHPLLT